MNIVAELYHLHCDYYRVYCDYYSMYCDYYSMYCDYYSMHCDYYKMYCVLTSNKHRTSNGRASPIYLSENFIGCSISDNLRTSERNSLSP